MKLTSACTLALSAAIAAANTVQFISEDTTDRTIVWTASVGHEPIENTIVPGGATVTVNVPDSWIGNWFSVSDGSPFVPGMLGEVTFQGWDGLTYFDVSAIVNPLDQDGVKLVYPLGEPNLPVSGCNPFPCNNAYYAADDVQTKTTTETDLVCTLGTSSVTSRTEHWEQQSQSKSVRRDFVLGKSA